MKKVTLITWHGGTGGVAVLILNLVKQLKKDFYIEVCFIYKGGPVAQEIKALGIKTYFLGVKSGYDLNGLVRLRNYLNRNPSEIIHFFYMTPLIRLAYIFSKHKNIIISEHGCIDRDKELGRWFYVKYFHRLLKNTAKQYIVPSFYSAGQIIKDKIFPRHKIKVIYNGIDLSKFSRKKIDVSAIKKALGVPENHMVIGTVRGLTSKMGIDHMLFALEILLNQISNIFCIIIGDGYLRHDLENLANRLGIKHKIKFFGSQRDIPLFLNIIDIFIMPSVWETFGIAAIEAMAMKVPVVAYKVGGLAEVIGDAGILVEKREPKKMAEVIYSLINDEKKRKYLMQEGRSRVERLFDINRITKEYEELYIYF